MITVIDPVTAGIWGVRLLHEPLPTSTLGVATLAARGHQMHLLCPSRTRRDAREIGDGVVLHRFASVRTPVHPTFRVALPWAARRTAARAMAEINRTSCTYRAISRSGGP